MMNIAGAASAVRLYERFFALLLPTSLEPGRSMKKARGISSGAAPSRPGAP